MESKISMGKKISTIILLNLAISFSSSILNLIMIAPTANIPNVSRMA
jgi:hypothetical protein